MKVPDNPDQQYILDKHTAERIENLPGDDFEDSHQKADEILTDLLLLLGYEDTVKAFNNLRKWYA